ncbi:hypothetical protein chiPu_0021239 [Chiloscyllium punctatum]|uniref:Uncharacterized protein n=1 Tax=Chiloscyllium punctatum TaxID=137246 RepID=A0A401RPF8_CHIPU|nr:hypothetical protein [Chiloscyllium punctatum]
MWIKRHNRIAEELTKYVKVKGWTMFVEPRIKDKEGKLWIPDLIFAREHQSIVVDVTIRLDTQIDSLENAWEEKTVKYEHLEEEIRVLTKGTTVSFYGFVIGSRGKWFEKNNELLKVLGNKRHLAVLELEPELGTILRVCSNRETELGTIIRVCSNREPELDTILQLRSNLEPELGRILRVCSNLEPELGTTPLVRTNLDPGLDTIL